MKPDDFFAQLLPGARACRVASGVPVSFTLAQAALESGWGERAQGCNLFGMKADPGWHGAVTLVSTHEVIKGARVAVNARFRCYATWAECLVDHGQYFRQNPRYAKCFTETSGEGWCRAVAAAGYATDPEYAGKLISIIRAHNLTRFDQPEGVKK